MYGLAGNYFLGGDTYNTSRSFLDCFHCLDYFTGVEHIPQKEEVSRLPQTDGSLKVGAKPHH